jgi:hypothetical protein
MFVTFSSWKFTVEYDNQIRDKTQIEQRIKPQTIFMVIKFAICNSHVPGPCFGSWISALLEAIARDGGAKTQGARGRGKVMAEGRIKDLFEIEKENGEGKEIDEL